MRDSFPLTRREIAMIAAFWALYGFLSVANRVVDPGVTGGEPLLSAAALVAFAESLCWALLTPVVFWLAGQRDTGQWDTDRMSRARQVAIWIAAGVLTAVLMSLIGHGLRSALFPLPMSPEPHWPPRPPLWFAFLNAFVIYLGVLAAGLARIYSLRYQVRRAQATRLQAELAQAHLDALRHQLDPHFLFNTLNAVSTLVERDPRGARRMIARLSEMLRHSLEGADVPEIALRQELALLECYLDIMRIRFQGRLSVEMRVDDRTLDSLVPSLILQPLVENAIRHGVERLAESGRIEIASVLNGETVTLRVWDNGPGLAQVATSGGGVGIRNTVARLDRLYGTAQRFTLRPAVGGGTVAEVRLPFRPRSELRTQGMAERDDAIAPSR